MIRVTNNYLANQFLNQVNDQRQSISALQRQASSGNRIDMPHTDPSGAAKSMQLRQMMGEYQRYISNSNDATDRLNYTDAKLTEVNDYLQAIRTLAVQGATGTFDDRDLQKMGSQVEQLLRQIVEAANSKYSGESLFAGHRIDGQAFSVELNKVTDESAPVVTDVRYTGDIGEIKREIDRGEYMQINIPGNRAFWASSFRITSQTEATQFVADRNQEIAINGVSIAIHQGDTVEMIVDKINAAEIPVKAEIDNTTGMNFISLQSTEPQQLVLEDRKGGHVFQNLGLIVAGKGVDPTQNYAPSALVSTGSVFDKVIELRDALMTHDTEGINRGIGGMDEAIDNVLANLSSIGARVQRAEMVASRMDKMQFLTEEMLSKVASADVAETITDMKNVELMHQMTLQMGARILPTTLMDFLR